MSLIFLSLPPFPFPSPLPPFKFKFKPMIQTPAQTPSSLLVFVSHPPISLTNYYSLPSLPQPLASSWQPPTYVYPDPDPQFANAETRKFRGELRRKLLKSNEVTGDDVDAVVDVCAEILSEFLHKEYGGPGTLIVEPFTDMLLALKEKNLPGAPVAARAALLWAQNFVDRDWEAWFEISPNTEIH